MHRWGYCCAGFYQIGWQGQERTEANSCSFLRSRGPVSMCVRRGGLKKKLNRYCKLMSTFIQGELHKIEHLHLGWKKQWIFLFPLPVGFLRFYPVHRFDPRVMDGWCNVNAIWDGHREMEETGINYDLASQLTYFEYAAGDVFRRWFKYQVTSSADKKRRSRTFLKRLWSEHLAYLASWRVRNSKFVLWGSLTVLPPPS